MDKTSKKKKGRKKKEFFKRRKGKSWVRITPAIENKLINRTIIHLSVTQMVLLGVHYGHEKRNFKFLSSWMFWAWRKDIFIINLLKTLYMFRLSLTLILKIVAKKSTIWYISLNKIFGPILARYAMICGEVFNIYHWINGSLTNFRRVIGWSNLVFKIMVNNKFILRYKDRKLMRSFAGMYLHRKQLPFISFVVNVLDSVAPIDEFMSAGLLCSAIVDSDTLSYNISLPIPGNDDSLLCINYYLYLVTKTIITRKMMFNLTWLIWKFGYMGKENLLEDVNRYKFLYIYLLKNKNYNFEDIKFWLNKIDFTKNKKLTINQAFLKNAFLEGIYGVDGGQMKDFMNPIKRDLDKDYYIYV